MILMRRKSVIWILALLGLGLVALIFTRSKHTPSVTQRHSSVVENEAIPQPNAAPMQVPAHYEEPPNLSSLGPTLSPEQFTGKARDAYQVAREIPQTIAQMPCYCHCDRGMGHKSLHSCFEDNHASSCAVCVNEALMAYQLQKKQGLLH
jgi:Protein of unknown function with PCYCGC motif